MRFPKIKVPLPKSSILIGFPISKPSIFWGTHILGNLHVVNKQLTITSHRNRQWINGSRVEPQRSTEFERQQFCQTCWDREKTHPIPITPYIYENLTSKLWGLLNIYFCRFSGIFWSFGFAFVCHFCFALSFFCHLVLHFIVILLSFCCHLVLHFFLIFFVIFFSCFCRFLVRRGWPDPEPTWKIPKLTFYQHLSHLFVIFLSFSCRFVIQAQVPGSGADLESPKRDFASTGVILHLFCIFFRMWFALFCIFFAFFSACFWHFSDLESFCLHLFRMFFAFLRFGVILFACRLHFLSISFAFPKPKWQ